MGQYILKPKNQVVIFVDSREEPIFQELIELSGGKAKQMNLKVGDYLCSDRLCIERKTADDFLNSLIDGRLFSQAEELTDNFEKPVIIIEGDNFRDAVNENAVKAALSTIILDYGISILPTKNEEDTAKTIYWLAKREQMDSKRPLIIKGRKKPKQIKKLQEYIISGFPGVSTKISKRILNEFKSIKNFSNVSEDKLIKIDGVGKVLAKKLHKILNENYVD
jgi:Fanconi anemia group M protein